MRSVLLSTFVALAINAAAQLQLTEAQVPVITLRGQSNMVGRATPRLTNPLDTPMVNPAPEGVWVYWKGPTASLADQTADNGQWQPLVLGTNNGLTGAPGLPDYMGIEMTLGATLHHYFGKPVYIIKCAFSGTGVSSTLPGQNPPGNWNPTNRQIFVENYVRQAIEDLAKDHPEMDPVWVGDVWWGGESDAQYNVSKATFKTQFNAMMNYTQPLLEGIFGHPEPPLQIVNLFYWNNTREATIRAAFSELVAEHAAQNWVLLESNIYTRGGQLTPAQAWPIPRGNPINSTGAVDDAHMSHLGMKPLGRLAAWNVIYWPY